MTTCAAYVGPHQATPADFQKPLAAIVGLSAITFCANALYNKYYNGAPYFKPSYYSACTCLRVSSIFLLPVLVGAQRLMKVL